MLLPKRFTFSLFSCLILAMLPQVASAGASIGIGFQPVSSQELSMTSEPAAPNASAIILYRQVDRFDLGRNGLEGIPDFVKDLIHLKELGFAWNMKVRLLPHFLGNLPELQTLRLNADGLADIPDFLRGPKLSLITLGNNCTITTSAAKKKALERRFHGVRLDFEDYEYDCPDEK